MPIIITGMHRSGTSLTAAILKLLGIYLGADKELMAPAQDNPDGFYERRDIMLLNDALLERTGANWHTPPENGIHFWEDGYPDIVRQLQKNAEDLLHPFAEYPLWGIKDPRFAFTLDFWQGLIRDARYIICIRNPYEVAESLRVRQGFARDDSLSLWAQHYLWLDQMTQPAQRLVIHYSDLVEQGPASIMRMVDWLGLQPDDQQLLAAFRCIRPELRHHSSPSTMKAGLPAQESEVYQRWLDEARQYPLASQLWFSHTQYSSSKIAGHLMPGTEGFSPSLPPVVPTGRGQDTPPFPEGWVRNASPLHTLPAFQESILRLNRFTRDNLLPAYQVDILSSGGFQLQSPFNGERLHTRDSLFLPGNRIAYHFGGMEPFWVITGNIQFGYLLTWLYCERQGLLIRLADGTTGVIQGMEPIEYWSVQIGRALAERQQDKTGTEETLKPVIVIGHRNFAHHLWNELAALDEWISSTTPDERLGCRIVPLREPLGYLEEIFPALEGLEVTRADVSAKAINALPGCLLPLGSRKVTKRIREVITGYLQTRASGIAQHLKQTGIEPAKTRFWFSVRERDRTCLNQLEFLTHLAVRILDTWPDSAILLDGFAFPCMESDLNTLVASEQRALNLDAVIRDIRVGVASRRGEHYAARLHGVSGLSLPDNLYLARYVDYYVCHAGTLQHKLGWLYEIPGIIHTVLRGDNVHSIESWYASQVEAGIAPQVLPSNYVATINDEGSEGPFRNSNYLITDIPAAADYIIDQAAARIPAYTSSLVRVLSRKKCLLYGNWQLIRLLGHLNHYPAFTEGYEVVPMPVVARLGADDLARMQAVIGSIDVFISNEIESDPANPELASQTWINRLSPEAECIRIPTLRFSGYHPELFNFRKNAHHDLVDPREYHNHHILLAWYKGFDASTCQSRILQGLAGRVYGWLEAWEAAMQTLVREESLLDVHIADYLDTRGRSEQLFSVPNQPTSQMMNEMARRVLSRLLQREISPVASAVCANATHYPVNPQAYLQLGCSFVNSPEYYRIKGQDTGLREMIAGYYAFYDQYRDVAQWNSQKRLESDKGRTQATTPAPAMVQSPEPARQTSSAYTYIPVHRGRRFPLTSPLRLDQRTPPHVRLTLTTARWPDTGVAIIPGGRACLDFPCQYFDSQNQEITEVFDTTAQRPERVLSDLEWVKFSGKVCTVVVPGGGIFAHWLGDVLPALHLVELAGIDLRDIDYFIVNRKDYPYHAESFRKLGIDEGKVIPWSKSLRYIEADELIVPCKARIHLCMTPWIIDWLRQTFVPDWKQQSQQAQTGVRLYFSRGRASKRRVVNEAEVVALVEQYGFKTVYLEELSVTEAAHLIVQAEGIVAVHGAGLANMVFCRPGIPLIELYGWHISQEYWMTAHALGLQYCNLACPGADGRYYDEIDLEYGKHFSDINAADIRVDCDALAVALENRLPRWVSREVSITNPPEISLSHTPSTIEAVSSIPSPLFVFSACWRTGSTLLQRVLNGGDQCMIWGEPGYLDFTRKIHDMLIRQKTSQDWAWKSIGQVGLSGAWIPNLSPGEEASLAGLRAFFEQLYIPQSLALKADCRYWGFKEVRMDAVKNAAFLHKLFPKARFIFHFRHPVSCFESLRASHFARQFADPLYPMRVYRDNMHDVLQLSRQPPDYPYLILRHEDLIGPNSPAVIEEVFSWLGVGCPASAGAIISGRKLGGSLNKEPLPEPLTQELKTLLADLIGQMGYDFGS